MLLSSTYLETEDDYLLVTGEEAYEKMVLPLSNAAPLSTTADDESLAPLSRTSTVGAMSPVMSSAVAPTASSSSKRKRSQSSSESRPAKRSQRKSGDSSEQKTLEADKKRNKLGYHRTSVACSHCRRRKIRCKGPDDDASGRCANCVKLKKECTFCPVEEHAQERRPSRHARAPAVATASSVCLPSPEAFPSSASEARMASSGVIHQPTGLMPTTSSETGLGIYTTQEEAASSSSSAWYKVPVGWNQPQFEGLMDLATGTTASPAHHNEYTTQQGPFLTSPYSVASNTDVYRRHHGSLSHSESVSLPAHYGNAMPNEVGWVHTPQPSSRSMSLNQLDAFQDAYSPMSMGSAGQQQVPRRTNTLPSNAIGWGSDATGMSLSEPSSVLTSSSAMPPQYSWQNPGHFDGAAVATKSEAYTSEPFTSGAYSSELFEAPWYQENTSRY